MWRGRAQCCCVVPFILWATEPGGVSPSQSLFYPGAGLSAVGRWQVRISLWALRHSPSQAPPHSRTRVIYESGSQASSCLMIDETMSLARVGISLGRSTSKVQSPPPFLSLIQSRGWGYAGRPVPSTTAFRCANSVVIRALRREMP